MEALEFRAIARPSLGHGSAWYQQLSSLDITEPGVEAVGKANVALDARVLEVGCGNGRLLQILACLGFTNLRGIDPFLPGDFFEGGITLQKRDVDDLDRSAFFDLIILYHALEHVRDPIATLHAVREHLTRAGVAIVAMPIVSTAFREYGANWYQLDPPRHLHLFSTKSFEIALARSGLRLSGSYFNSTAAQFRLSEAYARNVALSEIPPPMIGFGRARFPELLTRQEARYRARAHALNAAGEGDQAVFYLRQGAETTRAG
jgi:SAM-dependent methyltransferase